MKNILFFMSFFYHLFSSIAHLYSVEFFFTEVRELYRSIFFLLFARRESTLSKALPYSGIGEG